MNNSKNFWRSMADRYLDAETTREEEDALMRFVASPQADADFDDIRAIMSLTVVARRRHHYARRRRRIIAAASSAAAVVALLLWLPSIGSSDSEYIVYSNGTVRTDKAFAMSRMHEAFADMHRPASDIDADLSDMFDSMDEKN